MASVEECADALHGLAERFAAVDPDVRGRLVPDRLLGCTLTDLDRTFVGRLDEHGIHDIGEGNARDAQVRLSCTSDDLLAMLSGELNMAGAWARGRLHVEASVRDLLRLRSMLG